MYILPRFLWYSLLSFLRNPYFFLFSYVLFFLSINIVSWTLAELFKSQKSCFATYICQIFKMRSKGVVFTMLENQLLSDLLKFSSKKVVIMFGQFAESIYLCIRNREGHPLRVLKERVLWKYFPYRQVVQEAILWCRHEIG